MHDPTDDARVVSIAALIAAMRHESVADPAIQRILAAALGLDEATARAHTEGRPSAPITDPAALHALLTEAQQRGDWPAVVTLLARIGELESDPMRRARYLDAMATVQRLELADLEAALDSLEQALDCDPSLSRAFATQTAILTGLQDWKRLERMHRRMLHRIHGQGDTALQFTLFQALAVIYRDRLAHDAAAIEAFKMALHLRPDDQATRNALQALGVDLSE